MAQLALGLSAVSAQISALSSRPEPAVEAEAAAALRRLWPENGDMLALQYAGTANLSKGSGIGDEAPKSLVERSRGFVEKSVRSVNRYVHDRLLEDGRGAAIDSLLAGGMPRPEAAAAAVARRRSLSLLAQGSAVSVGGGAPLRLFVGTFNVNGKTCDDAGLVAWLSSANSSADDAEPPDVLVIGFQEFVDLNAQNMLREGGGRRREAQARAPRRGCRTHRPAHRPAHRVRSPSPRAGAH